MRKYQLFTLLLAVQLTLQTQFKTANLSFIKCSQGQYAHGLECIKCMQNCVECNSSQQCLVCASSYTLGSRGDCQQLNSLKFYVSATILSCLIINCIKFLNCRLMTWQRPLYQQVEQPEQLPQTAHQGYLELSDQGSVWLESEYQDDFDPNETCSICLQDEVNVWTTCGHGFHPVCFGEWMQKKAICPNCRLELPFPIRIYCRVCHERYQVFNLQQAIPTDFEDICDEHL